MKNCFVLATAIFALAMATGDAGFASPAPRAATDGAVVFEAIASKGCKYKTDGTGNCLSPAFYRCQRDWNRCVKACKADVACQDKCEIKYAAQCGD